MDPFADLKGQIDDLTAQAQAAYDDDWSYYEYLAYLGVYFEIPPYVHSPNSDVLFEQIDELQAQLDDLEAAANEPATVLPAFIVSDTIGDTSTAADDIPPDANADTTDTNTDGEADNGGTVDTAPVIVLPPFIVNEPPGDTAPAADDIPPDAGNADTPDTTADGEADNGGTGDTAPAIMLPPFLVNEPPPSPAEPPPQPEPDPEAEPAPELVSVAIAPPPPPELGDAIVMLPPVTAVDPWRHVESTGDWEAAGDWSPDPGEIERGEQFTQTRDIQRPIGDFWINDATGEIRDDNSYFDDSTESRDAIGTYDTPAAPPQLAPPETAPAIVLPAVQAVDSWRHVQTTADWVPATDWMPPTSDVDRGEIFDQVRGVRRTIADFWINDLTGEIRDDRGHDEISTATREAVGTYDPPAAAPESAAPVVLPAVTAVDAWRHVQTTGDWQPLTDWAPDAAQVDSATTFTQTRDVQRVNTDFWINDETGEVRESANQVEFSTESREVAGELVILPPFVVSEPALPPIDAGAPGVIEPAIIPPPIVLPDVSTPPIAPPVSPLNPPAIPYVEIPNFPAPTNTPAVTPPPAILPVQSAGVPLWVWLLLAAVAGKAATEKN